LNPKNAVALNVRGLAKGGKNDFTGAVADFSEAIKIDPQFFKAYLNRIRANVELRVPLAVISADYAKASELDPKSAVLYQAVGGYCLQMNLNCKSEFAKLIELEPDNPYGYFGRATTALTILDRREFPLTAADDIESARKAIADMNKSLEINPKSGAALNNLARLQFLLGEYDVASASAERALALDPKRWSAFLLRGNARREKNEYEAALKDYAQAEALEPKADVIHFERALLYRKQRKDGEAMTALERALSLDPNNGDAIILSGVIKVEYGRYQEAIKDFESTIDTKKNNNSRWFFSCFQRRAWAEAEMKLGKLDDAERHYFGIFSNSELKGACQERATFEYVLLRARMGRPDVASDYLKKLEEVNPNYPALAETKRALEAPLADFNKQLAALEAKSDAERIEWERKRDAQYARERANSTSSSSKSSSSNELPSDDPRTKRAIAEYDRIHASIEEDIKNYNNAMEKYNKAGEAQFLYKGTYGRALRALDTAARTIERFLDEHGKYLPRELYDHIVSDYRKVGGVKNF
jgi:tetratricopeptide (TPR) repeat protein